MAKNPLRELLNRVIWDPRVDPRTVTIKFVSRGHEGGFEEVSASAIIKVTRDYVHLRTPSGGTKAIPLHRIIEVREHGRVIYSKPRGVRDR